MEIIVSIATILTGIVAILQLQDFIQKEPEKRNLVQLIAVLGAAGLVIAFAVNYLYFGPKAAGDRFLSGFRDFDSRAMQSATCVDTELYNALGSAGFMFAFGSAFASVQISDVSFVPVVNQMSFTWIPMSSFQTSQEIHAATLYIQPIGLTDFCIVNAEGL